MDTAITVAIISSVVAVVVAVSSAGLTMWGQLRSTRLAAELRRLAEAEKTISKFREPLARAAYDLQSRLFNILKLELIHGYLEQGNDRERSYVIDNTAFVYAQYFAWTEIIRREIQFINLGEDEQTRELSFLQDSIYGICQSDRFGPILRVFAGEQRAIGEELIREGPRGLECMGYRAFLTYLNDGSTQLVDSIRQDVERLVTDLNDTRPRLTALQHSLIELLKFLDPDFIRFPADHRTKVAP